ncbi:hypothetical protein JCM8097_001286 [Rhodosporidiobolus ruineniae]
MSATINWDDPAVTSFLNDVYGTPSPTLSVFPASVSAALQSVVAQNAAASDEAMEDPLLKMLPAFTYAMPVQIVIQGVTITLLGMLLVHLLFTIRYHAPLNRVNYGLQTTATALSLANTCAQLHIVISTLMNTGRQWPYMFDYIEVSIPKKSWSTPERGAWFFLQGVNAFLTHSTHIQFLTMLFPSPLEMKLILGLLGPLAVATAGLYFTSMSPHAAVNDLGDAIRNTANSALTLLYTFALFIWGLTLNRSRAWRTDGGTAAFGILALILGVLGTAVNFVEIKEDRMRWLPGVVTCILLWQSWVGFWWWVGAGMYQGEADDIERKREKARRREERKRVKREGKRRAEEDAAAGAGAGGASAAGDTSGARSAVGSLRRRLTGTTSAPAPAAQDGEAIEMRDFAAQPAGDDEAAPVDGERLAPPAAAAGSSRTRHEGSPASPGAGAAHSDTNSSTVSSSRPSTQHFYTPFVTLFRPFIAQLRSAHDAAAVAQAAKPPGLPEDERRKWGIRALKLHGERERGERRQAREGTLRSGGEMDGRERRAGFELDGGERLDAQEEDEGWVDAGEGGEEDDSGSSSGSSDSEEARARRRDRRARRRRRHGREDDEARRGGEGEEYPPRRRREGEEEQVETGDEPDGGWRPRPRGAEGQERWWWKGLVGRWRLKDVSQW